MTLNALVMTVRPNRSRKTSVMYSTNLFQGTGSVEDAGSSILDDLNQNDMNWDTYFRELYGGIVSVDKIEQFALKYKGSEEERQDIILAYVDNDGDMDKIMEAVPLAEPEDEDRVRGIIDELIDAKELKSKALYRTSSSKASKKKRNKAAKKEAVEAAKMAMELGLGKNVSDDLDALQALIVKKRSSTFDGMMENLLSKHGDPKEKKKNRGYQEPTEEEFARIQAELLSKKRKR
jgi:DnaJ family protein C protein 9